MFDSNIYQPVHFRYDLDLSYLSWCVLGLNGKRAWTLGVRGRKNCDKLLIICARYLPRLNVWFIKDTALMIWQNKYPASLLSPYHPGVVLILEGNANVKLFSTSSSSSASCVEFHVLQLAHFSVFVQSWWLSLTHTNCQFLLICISNKTLLLPPFYLHHFYT